MEFEKLALEIFRFQFQNNGVYADFVNSLDVNVDSISSVAAIPFLPVQFFKTHIIKTTSFEAVEIFESSGTTQTIASRHFIKDLSLYTKSMLKCFEVFYGKVNDWCIIGLLPSYLERKNSSLVAMVTALIKLTSHKDSGFYLNDHGKLFSILQKLEGQNQKTLLIGVTFGLLEFAEMYPMVLRSTVVMETGGMKGRRTEITRQEVHDMLRNAFGLTSVHSEYGMTELLSQAYSRGDGIFECPPWMKILVRAEDDPFEVRSGGSGVINVVDLANLYSCSFIATEDIGKLYGDGTFEVLGRLDNSDIRGCSLLAGTM